MTEKERYEAEQITAYERATKRIKELAATLVEMAEECDRIAEQNRILKDRLKKLEDDLK